MGRHGAYARLMPYAAVAREQGRQRLQGISWG